MTENSCKSREGYLMIDHRASPGMPVGFYEKAGIDMPSVGEGKMVEMATLTCKHCCNVFIMNPQRTRERAYCFKCNHYICDICEGVSRLADYVHTPFQKKVDDLQDQMARPNATLLLLQKDL